MNQEHPVPAPEAWGALAAPMPLSFWLSFALLLAAWLLLPRDVLASWSTDSTTNTAISTAPGNEQQQVVAADGMGGAIFAWSDTRSDAGDIYAQRVDGSGVPVWLTSGIAVCAAANAQTAPQVVSDGAGGAIIVWVDGRNGTSDIYAQRLNAQGTALWAAGGVPVCTAASSQSLVVAAADGVGGVVMAWEDARSSGTGDIYGQRLNSSGTALWAANGAAICTATSYQMRVRVLADGSGGAFFAWQDYRWGGFASGHYYDIYAQRMSATGTAQWTADGVGVCTATGQQMNPAITSDGSGGIYVAWSEGQYSLSTPGIWANRLSGAGAILWVQDGSPVSSGGESWPSLSPDGAGGFIVTYWGFTPSRYIAQRVSSTGWNQWGSGVTVCSNASDWTRCSTGDGAGGVILCWAWGNLYAQRLDPSGNRLWGTGGVTVSSAAGTQQYPSIALYGNGGVIPVWQDSRNGTWDSYAQLIGPGGRLGGIGAGATALVAPAAGSHVTTAPTFCWFATQDAAAYRLVVATDAALQHPVWSTTTPASVTQTVYAGTPLVIGTTYYWSVQAMTLTGTWTAFAPAWSVVRDAGTAGPMAPTLTNPASGAVIKLPETFSWQPVSGAAKYSVRLAADAAFSTLLWLGLAEDPSLVMPSGITGLTHGNTYYWAVSSIDAAGTEGSRSTGRPFTYSAEQSLPGDVTLLAPAQGELVTSQDVTFTWSGTGATSYDLTYSTDPGFPASSNSTWTVTGLTQSAAVVRLSRASSTVYWKVTPRNATGAGSTSAVRSFQYQYQDGPITSVVLRRPVGFVTVALNGTFSARAQVTGSYTGTLLGSWYVDGALLTPSFSVPMTAADGATFDSPALPATTGGQHTVQCRITSPSAISSITTPYFVADLPAGTRDHVVVLVNPTSVVANGVQTASVSASVCDANGKVLTADNSTTLTVAVAGTQSGVVAPTSGTVSSGRWTATYTVGTTPGTDIVIVTPSGLPAVSVNVGIAPGPLDDLRAAAQAYLAQLADLTIRGVGPTIVHLAPGCYDVAPAQAWVAAATVQDTAGLARFVLATRALLRIYQYDPRDAGNRFYGTGSADALTNPGVPVLVDDGVSNLQGILGLLLNELNRLEIFRSGLDMWSGALLDGHVRELEKLILDTIDKFGLAALDVTPVDPELRRTLADVNSILMAAAHTAIMWQIPLTDILTGPSLRYPADMFVVRNLYVPRTQESLDGALALAQATPVTPTNTYADAVAKYTLWTGDARTQAVAMNQQSKAFGTAAQFASAASEFTQLAALIPGLGGLMQLATMVLKIISLASNLSGLTVATTGLIEAPAFCTGAVAGVFGVGTSPETAPARLEWDAEAIARDTRRQPLWTSLLADQGTAQAGYEAAAREMAAAIGRADTTSCRAQLAALLAAGDSLRTRTDLAAGPITAGARAGLAVLAGFDSVRVAQLTTTLGARYTRLRYGLSVLQYLATPTDPVARQQALDDCNAAVAASYDERGTLIGAATPLFTLPAVPTLLATRLTCPDSVAQGTPFTVTATWANLGAGTSLATFARFVEDSGYVCLSADSVAIAALAPGDTALVSWSLRAMPRLSDTASVRYDVIRVGAGCSNGIGEYRTMPLRVRAVPGVSVDGGEPPHLALTIRPNPFTESSQITFGMHREGPASVRVLDLTGRTVATLVDGWTSPGWHTVRWDGRSAAGSKAAPGVYFVRFRDGSLVITQRIVRLR